MKKFSEYPLVSIVTPSYNQGQFIEETIQSVLNQDYPHIEYIVMDGGSTDNTLNILRKYENKITWISEKDKGQSDAINKGWRMARGEILAWLNSDDTYLPGAIRKAVDYFLKNPDKYFVYGKGYLTDENSNVIGEYKTTKFDKDLLKHYFYICQPAMFMRVKLIKKVGLLDANLTYGMDYDFVIRIAEKCELGFLNEYLANLRKHKNTKTLSNPILPYLETLLIQRKNYNHVYFNYIYSYLKVWLRLKILLPEVIIKFLAGILSFFKFIQLNKQLPNWHELKFIGCINIEFS